jgi:hypothetical protein
MTNPELARRVAEVRQRIAAAAARAGAPAAAVTLVAAAKERSPDEIRAVMAAGVAEIGQNYVQEALAKRPAVGVGGRWRLIGALQRNKAGAAVSCFETVDTVASEALASALQRRLEALGKPSLEVLLEIRLGDEPSKAGVAPAEAERLLAAVQLLPRLYCQGVMTIPPPGEPQGTRRWFARLRDLSQRLRASSGLELPVLSMGMSADFEVAIEEGATQVRLGTALFGPRAGGPRAGLAQRPS